MFLERLTRHGGTKPGAAALVRGQQTVGYGELLDRIDACAALLRRQGVGRDDVAGLTIADEIDHLVACLALMRIGAAQITLASHETPTVRDRLAARVGVTRLVSAGPSVALAAAASGTPAAVDAVADDDRPAIYLSGSGTTGDVKLMSLSQSQIAIQAARGYADYGDDRVLQLAPVEYNNGKRMRLYCLYHGGACIFRDDSGLPLVQLCRDQGVTQFDLNAYLAKDLVRASSQYGRLPDVIKVRIGGSRVPAALRADFRERVCQHLFISYGTTEVGGICLLTPEELSLGAEVVGQPLEGMELEILDPQGRPVPVGTVGEIRMRAPGMVTGYVGDAEATRRFFRDGWFQPGDMMSLSADRMLTFHGRADDMIILNSINIFPGEIERALESHPLVAEAAAYPIASGVHGQIPVAAVELRAGAAIGERELLAYARERLGVRAPRKVTILAKLPRSGQGKVLKRVLAEGRTGGA